MAVAIHNAPVTCSDFLKDFDAKIRNTTSRMEQACRQLSPEQFNRPKGVSQWSAAQVVEHVNITNSLYLPLVGKAVRESPKTSEDRPAKLTWFGKVLSRGAGPQGNVPAPRALMPGPGPFGFEVVDRFRVDHEQYITIAREAHGIDMSHVSFRNPFIPLFRQNLVDTFATVAAHAERHVQQVEQALPRLLQS